MQQRACDHSERVGTALAGYRKLWAKSSNAGARGSAMTWKDVGLGVCAAMTLAAPAFGQDEPSTPSAQPGEPPPVHTYWEPGPELSHEAFTVTVENDAFNYFGSSTDRYYTHGTHFNTLRPTSPPSWAERLRVGYPLEIESADNKVDFRWGWGFGQNIYTSEDILEKDPDDRPYAGLLWGSVSLYTASSHALGSLELQVGLVGPSAHAWYSQNERHDALEIARGQGWYNQINDEPGFVLGAERRWRRPELRIGPVSADRVDFLGGEIGTFRGNLSGGQFVRVGVGLSSDYGPTRSWPAPAGASFVRPTTAADAYLFAGYDMRLTFWDVTLNGNIFRDSASVETYLAAPEATAGIGFRLWRLRLQYAYVFRVPEFVGQDDEQKFGRFSISLVQAPRRR